MREVRAGAAVRFGPVITFLTSTPVGRARPADDRRIEALIPPRDVLVSGPRTHGDTPRIHTQSGEPHLVRSCPWDGKNPLFGRYQPLARTHSVAAKEPLDLRAALAAQQHAGARPMLALGPGPAQIGRLVDPAAAVYEPHPPRGGPVRPIRVASGRRGAGGRRPRRRPVCRGRRRPWPWRRAPGAGEGRGSPPPSPTVLRVPLRSAPRTGPAATAPPGRSRDTPAPGRPRSHPAPGSRPRGSRVRISDTRRATHSKVRTSL